MQVVTIGKKGTAQDIEAIVLGKLGMFSASYVAQRTGLSQAQVYGRWRAVGIKVRDIRNYGSEFNNQVADLARNQAAATIGDIKSMIAKLLPPPPNQHEATGQS